MSTFDQTDRLNEDGTVTFRIIPSNWHAYNISPDTYQSFNGDSWLESEHEYLSEHYGVPIGWREGELDVDVTYDHKAIVRALAEVAADWIRDTLWQNGLDSISNVHVVDSWSPAYYNFQSDGFEVELTCDPEELRALTEGFDVDAHAHDHYRSYDGFLSYVTGRLEDPEWRAQYDGEFRVEHLLAHADDPDVHGREWIMALAEAEYEVYSEHTTIEVGRDYRDSGYSFSELFEWAEALTPTQDETLTA